MRIGLVQMDVAWQDRDENHRRAAGLVERAAALGCDTAVLPEMFSTGFTMDPDAAARGGPPDTPGFLSALAERLGMNLIAGLASKEPGSKKGRNLCLALDRKGRTLASYSKMRPFPLVAEEKHYEEGRAPVNFPLDGMPSSVFICYDLRFPELFRAVARQVSAIFVVANWPAARADHWASLLKARAIENQCYVVGVNRTGTDGNGILYAGGSCVFGPAGDMVASAGEGEEVISAEVEPSLVGQTRTMFPFLPQTPPC